MIKAGVLAIQGDVSEHINSLENAMHSMGVEGKVYAVKSEKDLPLDALAIPGGESTTIGKLLHHYRLMDKIRDAVKDGMPVLGTCAGMILLAKEGNGDVLKTRQPLLELMDIKVDRNAFGRQRESFEADLKIPALGAKPFPAVFIRAPVIERVWGKAKPLAEYDGKIVFAREDSMLAVAFHPELTSDTRLHEFFLKLA